MRLPELVIIAGPSAVGKTTIAHAILKLDPRFEFVRSVTTRAKRGDSFDDEYLYITREEFLALIPVRGVLEHTEYAGALYGTPRSEVERITREGRIPLLVLDTNGVESVSAIDDIATCGVYIYDDINVMEERLYARFLGDNPTVEGLKKFTSRKEQNIADYKRIYDFSPVFYDFIENDGTVEDAARKVVETYEDFSRGTSRDDAKIAEIVTRLHTSVMDK
jgi:guanylate kinase